MKRAGRAARTAGALLSLSILLGGCGLSDYFGGWFGQSPSPPLPGERIPVLLLRQDLEPDVRLAAVDVRLPAPQPNRDWPQAGGYPDHAMHHLAAGETLERRWDISVGSGSASDARMTAQPIVVAGRLYTMDVSSRVTAVDAASGKRLWQVDVQRDSEDSDAFGGGIAYAEGRLFVATGFAQVVALNAEDGKVVWRADMPGPMRSAPTAAGGRVFVITIDNQAHALSAEDGSKLWTHTGISETAGLLGGASPAVAQGIVLVPYSSGELFALRVENGKSVWQDSLSNARRIDALSSLADIRGKPLIDRGRVFAISHSGAMVSIDLRTGARAWDREISGVETPWVAGNYLYVLSTDNIVFCLTRDSGRVKWLRQLPRYIQPDKKKGPVTWTGPVLASDRLIVAGSQGRALSISPYTGDVLGELDLPEGVTIAPIVANETLYFITERARVVALR
ncbi:MAG: PQQ-like beta-propeller repeat protein [Alphaproteobacteria bacterium]|nr:PQQ-like beta-propeller repeat protein [Alphaproteobacteria bacterium]